MCSPFEPNWCLARINESQCIVNVLKTFRSDTGILPLVYNKLKVRVFLELQCRHLIPALNGWAARAKYMTTCSVATHFPGHGCMNDLQLHVTLIHKLRGSLMCLSHCIDVLSIGVCTTRQRQTSGQLVQELNACTARIMICCVSVPYPSIAGLDSADAVDVGGNPYTSYDVTSHTYQRTPSTDQGPLAPTGASC